MFELCIRTHFSSAHHLRGYDGSCEAMHGHNWDIEVFVSGEQLDDIGLLVDFKVMKASVKSALGELDHVDLNELPEFRDQNPSSENIARYLFRTIGAALNTDTYRVSKITVYETPGSSASYVES